MDSRQKALRELEARPISELLAELCALADKHGLEGSPRVPTVTLHLSTGTELTGVPLRIALQGISSSQLLFHAAGKRGDFDLAYLPLSSIVAVIVHDAHLLVPVAEAPTRLELKRKQAEAEVQLRALVPALHIDIDWETVTDGEESRRALAGLLASLVEVVSGVATDDLGRAALREKLSRVSLALGEPPLTQMEKGELLVVARPDGAIETEGIKTTLEAAL